MSLTEVEPRIVPDATATLLSETIGTTSTTTTLQYVDDPAHPVTATPVNSAIPPTTTPTNPPQIVVVGNTPPVVQAAAPAANAVQVGVPTSTRPGDEWLYNTTANGMFVPFMTKTAYAAMIAAGNIANATTSSGWTFGATFGKYSSILGYIYNAPRRLLGPHRDRYGEPAESADATDRHRGSWKVRKSYAFSKDGETYWAATVFSHFRYHFCWPVRTLRHALPRDAGKSEL